MNMTNKKMDELKKRFEKKYHTLFGLTVDSIPVGEDVWNFIKKAVMEAKEEELKVNVKKLKSRTALFKMYNNLLDEESIRKQERKKILEEIKGLTEPNSWNENENKEQQGLRFGWRQCKTDILQRLEEK